MCHLIFVDNSTFLFESPQCIESGSQTIREHYARFGLVMHVGRGEKKSKTEEMHAPATLNQEPIPEGTRIELRGGAHIHLTTKFKYVGSTVTSKLSDNLYVNTRIGIANLQTVQMKELFRCKGISRRTKKFIYWCQSIPIITVLWGCATWALKEEEKRMLELFHHGAIRRILGTGRQRVGDEKITNSASRKKFLNMPTMMNIVKRRVLRYIGKVRSQGRERKSTT
jgi:hypothetical protein